VLFCVLVVSVSMCFHDLFFNNLCTFLFTFLWNKRWNYGSKMYWWFKLVSFFTPRLSFLYTSSSFVMAANLHTKVKQTLSTTGIHICTILMKQWINPTVNLGNQHAHLFFQTPQVCRIFIMLKAADQGRKNNKMVSLQNKKKEWNEWDVTWSLLLVWEQLKKQH
jgi:hypothetical protein